MADEVSLLTDALTKGAAAVGTIIATVIGFPILRNKWKQGTQDGKIIDNESYILDTMEERLAKQDTRIDEMDARIRKQAIAMTRMQMLILRLEGLLVQHSIEVSEDLKHQIEELSKELP